jgi:hypothetical protein
MSPVCKGLSLSLQGGVALAVGDVLRCHFVHNQLRLIVSPSTHCLLLLRTAAVAAACGAVMGCLRCLSVMASDLDNEQAPQLVQVRLKFRL